MKVKINNHIQIPRLEVELCAELKKFLTVENKAYDKVIKSGYATDISQYINAYHEDDDYLYVPRMLNTSERRAELGWETQDETETGRYINIIDHILLRDQTQIEAYDAALKNRNGILHLHTGAGKTALAIKYLATLKRQFIIFVHVEPLITQWIDKIVEFTNLKTEDIGVIGLGKREWEDRMGYICLVQTGYKLDFPKEVINKIGVCIYDEAHTMCSPERQRVLSLFPAKSRIGLTATVDRDDGLQRLLYLHIGPVIYSKPIRETGKAKIIFYPTFIRIKEQYRYTKQGSKLNDSRMMNNICENERRNNLILSLVDDLREQEKKTLILSCRKKQIYYLAEKIEDRGVITGDNRKKDHREQQYDKPIIIATMSILSTGLDIPGLNALILASPFAGYIPAFQSIGRTERLKDSVVYYLVDSNNIYKGYARKLARTYAQNGYSVDLTRIEEL